MCAWPAMVCEIRLKLFTLCAVIVFVRFRCSLGVVRRIHAHIFVLSTQRNIASISRALRRLHTFVAFRIDRNDLFLLDSFVIARLARVCAALCTCDALRARDWFFVAHIFLVFSQRLVNNSFSLLAIAVGRCDLGV